jgi:exopolyphosphatase / guanosine-5'-triphosphate,3'-diphosphate pyrophosphatase
MTGSPDGDPVTDSGVRVFGFETGPGSGLPRKPNGSLCTDFNLGFIGRGMADAPHMPAPSEAPVTVAGVDLGSNSFHMTVVRRESDGRTHVLDRIREPVRLAAGLNKHREITLEAQKRGWDALERMGERLRQIPQARVRAVGTNTLRQARNGQEFLDRGRELLGHPIEVISGTEEARLIFLGVAHSDYLERGSRLVVDIGGGSTEVIVGEGFEPSLKHSLYMGCVSFSQKFFSDDKMTDSAFDAAELAAAKELRGVREEFRREGWEWVYGSSGTIRAAGEVLRTNEWSEDGITLEGLDRLRTAMVAQKKISKLDMRGLDADRAHVFPGGVAVLRAIFRSLEIEQMKVATGALREGLAFELLGRLDHHDVRNVTVASFAERYGVDRAQARRVKQTALDLFDQCNGHWGIDPEEGPRVLGYAADLHEIGMSIAYTGYHKHDAYIIENAEMPGFSRNEQQVLACILRSHRRKIRRRYFKPLPPSLRPFAMRLAILLRIAVTLRRSRTDETNPEVSVARIGDDRMQLHFPVNWLRDHPLVEADLRSEAEYLDKVDFQFEFA